MALRAIPVRQPPISANRLTPAFTILFTQDVHTHSSLSPREGGHVH